MHRLRRWLTGDRAVGLLYLVIVPALIFASILFGYLDHRDNITRARKLSARAEQIAENSCRSSAILRDVLASVLPAKSPPNLTVAQKRQLALFREAVRDLGPLSCDPATR